MYDLRFWRTGASCLFALLFLMCLSIVRGQGLSNAEEYRPAFHFSPQKNWINDPAGLVFDGSEYHLFNQYNPLGDQWGHMSWSHSISKNLVSWRQLPVALQEENGVMIFTGSAVLDRANTSGFGKNGVAPMVALYTGNSTGLQTQNLAYSIDSGRTWTKYAGNPIIDLHESDFRDPMVFWYEPSRQWIMVVSLALKHKILFLSSPDLKTWTKQSEFGPAGANAVPNWECPNLFELPVVNTAGQKKWVLELGVGDGGPAGGSASQYFIGDFDGKAFTNDNSVDKILWVDYGADFYAAQTWSNIPASDGRRIAIAWMDSWKYANKTPTSPWRGQLSFPRTLGLIRTNEGVRLTQAPINEIRALRRRHFHLHNASWADARTLLSRHNWPDTLEIEALVEIKDAQNFGLVLRRGPSHGTLAGYDARGKRVYIDRTHSGDLTISPSFPVKHEAPVSVRDSRIRLHILLDRSSVELFADDGLVTITDLIYPRALDKGLDVFADGNPPQVISLDIWTLETPKAGK